MKNAPVITGIVAALLVGSAGCVRRQEPNEAAKEKALRQGARSFVAGDLPAAIKAKQELTRLDPLDITARYDLAMTLMKAKRNVEAVKAFNVVIASKQSPYAAASQRMVRKLTADAEAERKLARRRVVPRGVK